MARTDTRLSVDHKSSDRGVHPVTLRLEPLPHDLVLLTHEDGEALVHVVGDLEDLPGLRANESDGLSGRLPLPPPVRLIDVGGPVLATALVVAHEVLNVGRGE